MNVHNDKRINIIFGFLMVTRILKLHDIHLLYMYHDVIKLVRKLLEKDNSESDN